MKLELFVIYNIKEHKQMLRKLVTLFSTRRVSSCSVCQKHPLATGCILLFIIVVHALGKYFVKHVDMKLEFVVLLSVYDTYEHKQMLVTYFFN